MLMGVYILAKCHATYFGCEVTDVSDMHPYLVGLIYCEKIFCGLGFC